MSSALQSSPHTSLHRLAAAIRAENSGAWLRFLLAAVGLTLAFAAAIFSTASRDAGNVVATVVLASFALLMAAAVGLGIVPYLAHRVGTQRVREALDFEVTRAGALYAIVVLVIGIAALNTGNNLLYIIVAAMLAAIAVSGIASALCLRRLELDLKIPDHIFAGTEIPATVCVRNPRRWVPSLSISAVPIEKSKESKRWPMVAASGSQVTPGDDWVPLRSFPSVCVLSLDSSRSAAPGRGKAEFPAPGALPGALQPLYSLSLRLSGEDPTGRVVARSTSLSRID